MKLPQAYLVVWTLMHSGEECPFCSEGILELILIGFPKPGTKVKRFHQKISRSYKVST